jgi:hypothetical protein
MMSRDSMSTEHQQMISREHPVGWRTIRPRRPVTIWGWLLWLLVVVFFYVILSYVIVPWYRPVPTDVPLTPPNNSKTT